MKNLIEQINSGYIPTEFLYTAPRKEIDLHLQSQLYSRGIKFLGNFFPSGSELFSKIVQQPEYYLDQDEINLISSLITDNFARNLHSDLVVTELGPGNGSKTSIFLNKLRSNILYQPIDVSYDFIKATIKNVEAAVPHVIGINPICSDFFNLRNKFNNFAMKKSDILLFLGTTISNFTRKEAEILLGAVSNKYLKNGGFLVIGHDANHDFEKLSLAYDDSRGFTRAFVIGALLRLRDEYQADIDLDHFSYIKFFDYRKSEMNMGLNVNHEQVISTSHGDLNFCRNSFLRAGRSKKYTVEDIQNIVSKFSLSPNRQAISPNGYSLQVFQKT